MKTNFQSLAFYLLISAGILFSCEDGTNIDEPKPITTTVVDSTETSTSTDEHPSLVGTWTYDSVFIAITIDGQDLMSYLMDNYEITEEEAAEMQKDFEEEYAYEEYLYAAMNSSIEFNEDGSFMVKYPGGEESGSWTKNENDLIITYDGESQAVSVLELTMGNIVLGLDELVSEDVNGDENDETISITVRLILAKKPS